MASLPPAAGPKALPFEEREKNRRARKVQGDYSQAQLDLERKREEKAQERARKGLPPKPDMTPYRMDVWPDGKGRFRKKTPLNRAPWSNSGQFASKKEIERYLSKGGRKKKQ